ncbi:MAG: group II intron reverse transcriptase/maturase [Lachnospiraceae bacterium]|nr:group II intron reverse transcriptase/maturase [Lachnospiraceae bacterium]
MNPTSEILERINKSSAEHHDGVFTRLYRYLLREDIYYAAYQKLYSNSGALTPGSDNDTADGFSREYVLTLIEELKNGTYKPKPVRREYIQKQNGKMRPLGIPSFRDKLLQEAVRMILEAIYEPVFYDQSHGFRPNRSCHTALEQIKTNFRSVKWFIEGDIKGCFDNIDHKVLIQTLEVKIKDSKFINIIRAFLKAGYIEDFQYHTTISGTPQGGIVSPILANIYLHELDRKVMELKESFDSPSSRKLNPEYLHLAKRRQTLQKKIDRTEGEEREQALSEYKQVCSQKFKTPARMCDDKKLVYCRYADDFLIGISGSKEDCEEIKEILREFLDTNYHLELSAEKTKITHSAEKVRFLGYDIAVRRNQEVKKRSDGKKQRTLNNSVELTVPLEDKIMRFLFKNGIIEQRPDGEIWPVCIPRLRHMPEVNIVNLYNAQIRGICNYYCLAANYHSLNYFHYLMEYSCLKTLASKSNSTTKKIIAKYHLKDGWGIPYETKAGVKYAKLASLADCKAGKMMSDRDPGTYHSFNVEKLSQYIRLSNGVCELCGASSDSCCIYHAGKMKNLKSNTDWGKRMLHMKRKTLIVCPDCYRRIRAEQNN